MSIFVPKKKKAGPDGRSKAKKKSPKASLIKDQRIPKLLGMIVVMLGVFVLVSGISYLFTWKIDQDKILNAPFSALGEGDLVLANWLGRLGAVTGNALIYWGFGVASLIVPILAIGLGLRKFLGVSLEVWYSRAGRSILSMVFLSMVLAFTFSWTNFPWGGSFGESTTIWLTGFMGRAGLIMSFLFILAATIIVEFNPVFEWKGNFMSFSRFKMPEWKMSLKDLGLDIFKKKPSTDTLSDHNDGADEEDQIEDENEEEGTLRPGFLNKYMKEESSGQEEADDDMDDIEALELELGTLEEEESKKDSGAPELEINDSTEEKEKSEVFSDGHIPSSFSGVQDKVFLMDQENADHSEPYDPTLDLSSFESPVLELLHEYSDGNIQIDRAEVEANKDQIIETLLNYKIEITKIRATIGPTVTLYEIIPKPGIRISKIKNLEDDIALSLSALGIRIIAPIPGKGTIGIEVPNKKKQIVSLKEVLNSDKFISGKMDLPIALGKTISNEVFVADLAKMPHLLIAGATGQGKSVGINTVLMSLLYRKHPSQLKLVLIDPKKVELFPYAKLANHFLAFLPDQKEPIVTETKKVIHTLNSLCIEMDDRYDLLKKAHSRNLKEYNEKFVNRQLNPLKGHRFMPFIVLVIDEFADLIMTAGKEVEMPISRLAQLARAVGIHLIIATQRPSVNIITGVIKANFPARLAYKVASKVDSRTILDMGGAEQLIGQGDMLLSIGSNMIRLQCAFVDTPEVENVINHVANQKGYPSPYYLPEYVGDDEPIQGADGMTYAELDDMFEEAARLVVQNQHGSTSMIQRRLKLGYNRAGRIMDQLQSIGVVGPAEGSKPREVLMFSEDELDGLIERMRTKS